LETVFEQLDSYKLEREEQQRDYESELQVLHEQVKALESEAVRAQTEIEAQQKRCERDSLTELPNREAYERRLGIELERSRRYERKFCLVVADVDHFKMINDRYGHLAGDKVLKVLAKTIRQRIRRADFIARYGGEEFVIILPETDAEQAVTVMSDICSQIRGCPFHFKSEPLKITVSFGIAEVSASDDHETLFARADKAMYQAKDQGRDRCYLAENVA
jgi:diguanylate cyclase